MGIETILIVLAVVVVIAIAVGARRAKRNLGSGGSTSADKSPPTSGGVR
jgi:hypothetical protein